MAQATPGGSHETLPAGAGLIELGRGTQCTATIGHEFGHLVTISEGLRFPPPAGLGEGTADVFGALFEHFTFGSTRWPTGGDCECVEMHLRGDLLRPNGLVRLMCARGEPLPLTPVPDHYSRLVDEPCFVHPCLSWQPPCFPGGAHINNKHVIARLLALLGQEEEGEPIDVEGVAVRGLGVDQTERLYYRALQALGSPVEGELGGVVGGEVTYETFALRLLAESSDHGGSYRVGVALNAMGFWPYRFTYETRACERRASIALWRCPERQELVFYVAYRAGERGEPGVLRYGTRTEGPVDDWTFDQQFGHLDPLCSFGPAMAVFQDHLYAFYAGEDNTVRYYWREPGWPAFWGGPAEVPDVFDNGGDLAAVAVESDVPPRLFLFYRTHLGALRYVVFEDGRWTGPRDVGRVGRPVLTSGPGGPGATVHNGRVFVAYVAEGGGIDTGYLDGDDWHTIPDPRSLLGEDARTLGNPGDGRSRPVPLGSVSVCSHGGRLYYMVRSLHPQREDNPTLTDEYCWVNSVAPDAAVDDDEDAWRHWVHLHQPVTSDPALFSFEEHLIACAHLRPGDEEEPTVVQLSGM